MIQPTSSLFEPDYHSGGHHYEFIPCLSDGLLRKYPSEVFFGPLHTSDFSVATQAPGRQYLSTIANLLASSSFKPDLMVSSNLQT
jgi:hypothetical protein